MSSLKLWNIPTLSKSIVDVRGENEKIESNIEITSQQAAIYLKVHLFVIISVQGFETWILVILIDNICFSLTYLISPC